MKLKDKITNFLETGTSSWTDEPVIRAPTRGNPVFLELLEQHKELLNYHNVTTFFECGTYNGNNAGDFSNAFDKVITVESDIDRYRASAVAHIDKKNITFLHGDGATELKSYLIKNPDERMVILLDDHVGYVSFISQELGVLQNNSNVDHIIIVDDADKLGKGTYPLYEEIVKLIDIMNKDYTILQSEHKLLIFVPTNNTNEVK